VPFTIFRPFVFLVFFGVTGNALLYIYSEELTVLSTLKVVTNEKIGGSGVTSTLGTWYGDVVMGVPLSFNEAAIEISTVRRHKSEI
jgi:hypothetical protein